MLGRNTSILTQICKNVGKNVGTVFTHTGRDGFGEGLYPLNSAGKQQGFCFKRMNFDSFAGCR